MVVSYRWTHLIPVYRCSLAPTSVNAIKSVVVSFVIVSFHVAVSRVRLHRNAGKLRRRRSFTVERYP